MPFGEADAEVFYGREVLAAQLVTSISRRLSAPGVVVVTGASGAGKSSLLRAGLLPAIGRGELTAAAREWPVLVVEPTGSPLTRLATALAALAGVPAPEVVRSLREEPGQAPLLVRQAVETDARRRRQLRFTVLAGLLVVAIITAVVAVRVGQDAKQQRALAASRGAAAYSQSLPGDPATSARLAAAAQAIAPTGEARVSMAALLGQPARAVLTGHTDEVNSVAFSPDGKLLATSGEDGTVRIWDATTHKQIGDPLIDYAGTMPSVAFSPDSTRLAASGDNGTVWIWDAVTREQIWNATADSQIRNPYTGYADKVLSVAFSPDGTRLASAGDDSTVWIWDVALPRDLLRAVCDLAGRSFTRQEWQQYIPSEPYQPNCPTVR